MAGFGEILAELRQDKRLTQRQLGEIIFVSAGTISNYENGANYPDVPKLISLAEYFEVSVDYLLGRSSSRLTPDVFKQFVANEKTVAEFIDEFRALPLSRQKALLLIMRDMELGQMVDQYHTREKL